MGKIKSKMIKNSGKFFIQEGINFTESFEENKKILAETMPGKKLRNQMAGFLVRVKKQEKENQLQI